MSELEKWENEKMRKLGNEKMGCEVVLEEWGYASEIKQILNKIKATPCKVVEVCIVSLFNFGKVLNFAKVWDEKAMC